MLSEQELDRLAKLANEATEGPGEILHSRHISEPGMKDELLKSVAESIDKSIAHDGGHPWVWIEVKDRIKVAEFGCGPTSLKNALFWGAFREHAPALIALAREALVLREARERFKRGNVAIPEDATALVDVVIEQRSAREIVQAENDRLAAAIDEAVAEAFEEAARLVEKAAIPGDQHDLCLILADAIRARRKP